MSASSTDKLTKVGSPGTATTLAAPGHSIAGTSITVVSTTNWPTTTGVVFAMDTVSLVNGVEVRNVGSYTEWEGVVSSGTTVTSMVLKYGTDQNYPAGSTTRVYIPVSSTRENQLIDALTAEHSQVTGAHNAAAATTIASLLPTGSVAGTALADGGVTNAKLAANTAWTSTFVPVITASVGTITTATATCRYQQIGKTVFFTMFITITANGTGSGTLLATLPVTAQASAGYIASGREDSISGKMQQAKLQSSTQMGIINYDNTYPVASGSTVRMSGFYEAA